MKEVFVTVRLPKPLYDELKAVAEDKTRSMSAQIMHFIKQGIATSNKKDEQND